MSAWTRRMPAAAPDWMTACALRQDEDVLDTWFSSALWPFTTLGWPENTDYLQAVLSDQRAGHRFRHHLFLGSPDDHDGPEVHGRCAVPDGLHPWPDPRRPRAENVQVEGQRAGSAGPDRRHRTRTAGRQAHHRPDAARRWRRPSRRPPARNFPTASRPTARMPCDSPSPRWRPPAATSVSTWAASRATAISATSCGTRPASCCMQTEGQEVAPRPPAGRHRSLDSLAIEPHGCRGGKPAGRLPARPCSPGPV